MQFAANLDMLWAELPPADAVRAAADAGFAAVELAHVPADAVDAVAAALDETSMPLLALTAALRPGDTGCAAVPGREAEASLAIDQAIAQAVVLDAGQVHVMAGRARGAAAYDTLLGNLDYACNQAALHGLRVVIGPQNTRDLPGAFVTSLQTCLQAMRDLNRDPLRLMFDCYEVARTDGDLTGHLADLQDRIGVIRFAGVPDRGAPDRGEVNFAYIFRQIEAMGYDMPLSASYHPPGPTGMSLGWMRKLRPQVIRPWQLAASGTR